jgi:hypothetical protein
VIDLVVIRRQADNSIKAQGRSELSADEANQVRAYITDALGFQSSTNPTHTAVQREGSSVLIGVEDVRSIAEMLGPGEAALVIVVEHQWANRLGKLMRRSGVTLLEDYMLTPEVLSGAGAGLSTW